MLYRSDAPPDMLATWDGMVRDWRRAGVRRIREGAPFAFTAGMVRNRLASHPVVALRSGSQELAVVPALGGRAIEWHVAGRQWLAPPDPDNPWMPYPMSEGYVEFAVFGMYTYRGWAEPFTVLATAPDSVRLRASVGDGLVLVRTYRLIGDSTLTVQSRLANRGRTPVTCTWGAAPHLSVPPTAVLRYRDADADRSLPWADIPPAATGARILQDTAMPTGQWHIDVPGARVTHRFPAARVARAIVGRIDTLGILAIDIRSPETVFAPGAAVVFEQELTIVRQ
jgi:hypothetical protein